MVAALFLVGVIAVAGWVRKPADTAYAFNPATNYTPANVNALPSDCVTPADSQYFPAIDRAVYRRAPAAQYASAPTRAYAPAPRTRTYVKERPLKKSAMIVAGSAGVGAAIGALAGGGRGAAIGALSGGAAGFIYDRVTHRKRVTVTQ